MAYSVKELVYTLQGEGKHTGRPAVFCRFAGCNLWTGREADRAEAICQFCDTDFVGTDGPGGGVFAEPQQLAAAIADAWPAAEMGGDPFVVFTGGEPLLQLDEPLIGAVKQAGFEIAVETNGTLDPPPGIDWLCVSPKAASRLVVTRGEELKLVYPQSGIDPADFVQLDFAHFYLQPLAGPQGREHWQAAVAYCLAHPRWKLSLQTHKLLGIR
jgi:7-carboxy-7-deazaguanine synthase (Cx14CxxC type)